MSAKPAKGGQPETRLLKKPFFRILIVANFVLLMGITYIGVKVVNDRVQVMATEETAKLCQQLINMVYGDGIPLEQAQAFAIERLSTGSSPIPLRLLQVDNGLTIESTQKLFSNSAFEETEDGAIFATTCVVAAAQ